MFNAVVNNTPGAGMEPESPMYAGGGNMMIQEDYCIPCGSMGTDYGMPQFGGTPTGQAGGADPFTAMFMMFGMFMQVVSLMMSMVLTTIQLAAGTGSGQAPVITDTSATGDESVSTSDEAAGEPEESRRSSRTDETDETGDDEDDDASVSNSGNGDDDVETGDPQVDELNSERDGVLAESREREANWDALS